MRHVIKKLFWAWDFEKEEKWLNEMAAKGLCLVSVGFCRYEFEDCAPGEYKICLQLLDELPTHPESRKYIEFLESTGAKEVGTLLRWVYFCKRADEGDFELFSDNASRIKYVSGIISFVSLITLANLLIGIYNIAIARLFLPINYIGIINLLVFILGSVGVVKLLKKRKKIKEEGRLYE